MMHRGPRVLQIALRVISLRELSDIELVKNLVCRELQPIRLAICTFPLPRFVLLLWDDVHC